MDHVLTRTTGVVRRIVRLALAVAMTGAVAAPLWAASETGAPKAPPAATTPSTTPADQPKASDTLTKQTTLPTEAQPVVSVLDGTDLGRMLRRDISSLQTRRLRGMTALDVEGGFRSVLVMHTAEDGKLVMSCITDEAVAEAIFAPRRAPDVQGDGKEP